MQTEQLKQRIERIEQCADDAKRASQGGSVPQDLKQSIQQFHEQASAAKHSTQGQASPDADSLRSSVMQLEQTADRAMQACRSAGNNLDPKLQQAVQRAHAEASSLKKELLQEA